jgi:hypothetical protein
MNEELRHQLPNPAKTESYGGLAQPMAQINHSGRYWFNSGDSTITFQQVSIVHRVNGILSRH